MGKKMTTEEFIRKAREIHGDKYDYSNVEYTASDAKVRIICPEHGEFLQRAYVHLLGHGCPACSGCKRPSTEEFIQKAREIHGDKYDYSKVEYQGKDIKVCIICPIHGEFWQRPHNHITGRQGCPDCGKKYAREWRKNDYSSFISASKERFGDNYSFPHIDDEYENSHSKLTIKCNKCGNEFIKIACDHLTSPFGGCRHCYHSKSKAEDEIADFVLSLVSDDSSVRLGDRELLNGHELDVLLPNQKLAIEFNGLYWHGDKDKNYHLMKTEMCEKHGIRLIQIFEDEYTFSKEIIFSKLKHILGKDYDLEKVYGRKCTVKEITYQEASDFLSVNHIQGKCKSTVYLGAFQGEQLCGVMTFLRISDDNWELTRFATDITKQSIGVGGKLFKHFVREYSPIIVKSFADRRWTVDSPNNLYRRLGFELDSVLRPDYRYHLNGGDTRIHKFNFRKKILNKKYGLSMDLTESQMAEQLKARKIWDCGLFKYVWINKNNNNLKEN